MGEKKKERQRERGAYLGTCPSRRRMVFICERRSGSSVAGE